ncbi:MAG: hypothetical protein HQK54_10025, partial [Oligoflexales bacterium]|nr:hypothetical protein [Oligoflexales bacterium]
FRRAGNKNVGLRLAYIPTGKTSRTEIFLPETGESYRIKASGAVRCRTEAGAQKLTCTALSLEKSAVEMIPK